jgi:hypothetical protein
LLLCPPEAFDGGDIPIEILALDFDIGHAIADFALSDLPRCFFLSGTHPEDRSAAALICRLVGVELVDFAMRIRFS